MITQFPTIYPDELLYSQLARYYVRSGHLEYTFAAEELFQSKAVRPDVEFLNAYTSEALAIITAKMSLKDIIMKHTMFPYYGRFLKQERRSKAFASLVNMHTDFRNLLPIPTNKDVGRRYLRYCPVCVRNDRQKYGEAYWHRSHQMVGVDICPIHHCYLINSSVVTDSATSPNLVAAEEVATSEEIVYSDSTLERSLAGYVFEVLNADIDLLSSATAGKFLHFCIEGTKYKSRHGKLRNMELLYSDFMDFYKEFPNQKFNQQWQVGKVFSDGRHSTIEICMLAMFLGASTEDLTRMKLPEQIHETCQHKNSYHSCGGQKRHDWSEKDVITLPRVKEVIADLQENESTRPVKITVGMVERLLGMQKNGLRKLTYALLYAIL